MAAEEAAEDDAGAELAAGEEDCAGLMVGVGAVDVRVDRAVSGPIGEGVIREVAGVETGTIVVDGAGVLLTTTVVVALLASCR